jgi:hypothetical protein
MLHHAAAVDTSMRHQMLGHDSTAAAAAAA